MLIGMLELAKLGFYVELKEKFRKLVRKKIYKKFETLKQFSVQTKIISSSYLSSILKASGYTELAVWLRICKVLDVSVGSFKENILKIRAKNGKFFLKLEQLPILTSSDLASLVGHGFGDGHITEEGCLEYTNKEMSLHTEVLRIIYKLFGVNEYAENDRKNVKRRRYNVIVGKITHLAGVPKGNKITQSFSVPRWILNGSEKIRKSFTRALFDDEGTVKSDGREILIKFSRNEMHIASLQKFMEQIKQLLEDLGIEATSVRKENVVIGKNGRTIQLVLGIHGYKNFARFFKEVNFTHTQKQKELKKLINSYKSFQNKKGETQKILYKNLSEPLTIHNLTNKLNMTYIAVYKGMRKLEEDGLVRRMGYSENQSIIWKRTE